MGANMIIHKADAIFFQEGLVKEINKIKELVGKDESIKPERKIQI